MGAKSGRNKRGGNPAKGKGSPQSKGSGSGKTAQRLGLILFGVAFVALFVIFAVADGLGAPSVPSGDIALVSNLPGEEGHISEADYKKTLESQESQAGLKKPPKAGSKKAEELHEATIRELLEVTWILGEGEELGIKVTEKEIETELAKVKKESFPTPSAYKKFLEESHYTQEDVNERIELQIISSKIQEKITKEAPEVSEARAEEYYEAEKASQYTKKPSRDVRVVVNENKKEVEAAQKALEADNSAKSWEAVTKKYSPTTEANGGLQKEISEEFLTEPLKKDIFTAKVGELVGPVKQEKNYLLLEVVKLHKEEVQPFSEVKSTIATQLNQEEEQKYFTEWFTGFREKWISRTTCADGFATENCGNFKGSGRPAGAAEACYEANPKAPAKECPAPVVQNQPAIPGSVTPALPEGERKVQRPLPLAEKKKGKEGAAAAEEGAATEAGAETAPAEGGAEPSAAETEAAIKQAEEEAAATAEAAKESNK